MSLFHLPNVPLWPFQLSVGRRDRARPAGVDKGKPVVCVNQNVLISDTGKGLVQAASGKLRLEGGAKWHLQRREEVREEEVAPAVTSQPNMAMLELELVSLVKPLRTFWCCVDGLATSRAERNYFAGQTI